jgi:hypothetical protein
MKKDDKLRIVYDTFKDNDEVMGVFELLVEMVFEIDRKLKNVSGCGTFVKVV